MPRQELIAAKKAHIGEQIAMLEARTHATVTVGSRAVIGPIEETAFQRRRLAELEWAEKHSDAQIRARIKAHAKSIGPEALACKYGDMRGLTPAEVETICLIEVLEIAIGTHPGVK